MILKIQKKNPYFVSLKCLFFQLSENNFFNLRNSNQRVINNWGQVRLTYFIYILNEKNAKPNGFIIEANNFVNDT